MTSNANQIDAASVWTGAWAIADKSVEMNSFPNDIRRFDIDSLYSRASAVSF